MGVQTYEITYAYRKLISSVTFSEANGVDLSKGDPIAIGLSICRSRRMNNFWASPCVRNYWFRVIAFPLQRRGFIDAARMIVYTPIIKPANSIISRLPNQEQNIKLKTYNLQLIT